MVRMPLSHSGGPRFESWPAHQFRCLSQKNVKVKAKDEYLLSILDQLKLSVFLKKNTLTKIALAE